VTDGIYSAMEIVRLTGVSYRQLDYWDRSGLLSPTKVAAGSRWRRRYSASDLQALRLIKALLDMGIRLERIRRDGHPLLTVLTLRGELETIGSCLGRRLPRSAAVSS